MKMTMKSSMGAGQEMRKGNKTSTTAARAGEKMKNLQDMITKLMQYIVIMYKMPDMMTRKIKTKGMIMKMKMPEQTMMEAGCRTLIFKSCFSSRRITQELPPERKPRWINLS